jgi:hypothetical protein
MKPITVLVAAVAAAVIHTGALAADTVKATIGQRLARPLV